MIIIKVSSNTKRFIKKCLENNIYLYNITYYDDYILVTIKKSDLKQIKKLNYYSKITFYKHLGKRNILLKIKTNLYNIILLLIFISLLFAYSNIIISVEIKHENKDIINKINDLLVQSDIKRFTIVKSNQELNKISDKILAENREFLDFISITRHGMKYIINIEERIIKQDKKKKDIVILSLRKTA